jgi:endonuclease/exonuclease/phosphatase family metal-dependent hydrolase
MIPVFFWSTAQGSGRILLEWQDLRHSICDTGLDVARAGEYLGPGFGVPTKGALIIMRIHHAFGTVTTLVIAGWCGIPQHLVGQSSEVVVRILAYNVRHGAGMDDSVDLRRAAAVINEARPDIVALQEIDSATSRTGHVDQAARLGALTNMQAVFGGFMEYRGGQYGMAVLSRHTILSSTNHRLPDGEEPRTALAVTIQIEGVSTPMVVVGIHLYGTEGERLAQAQRLTEVLQHEHRPVVLVGDFNSLPGTAVIEHLAQSWSIPAKDAEPLTFPADVPDREIDYIMLRPATRFEVLELRVIDEVVASDHRPVLLVAKLREERH